MDEGVNETLTDFIQFAMIIREASEDDTVGVRSVLDGANLAVSDGAVAKAIRHESIFVAATPSAIIGAIVLDGSTIEALAVRRKRRGRGIGSALVWAAAARQSTLHATFRRGLRPFYESVGFKVTESLLSDRLRGQVSL